MDFTSSNGTGSTAPTPCDVLIIGGGPAGSTAAALLAERGRNVVLLEKDAHPRFHIGESLLPRNLAVFERLGILDEIAKIGVHKPGAEFVSDAHGGKRVVFDFSAGIDRQYTYSFQVRRAEFDSLLFENAKRKGATAYENVRVVDVQFRHAGSGDDGRSLVTAEAGADGQHRQWAPRFVIDASGRDTFLAGRLGSKTSDKKNSTAALFAHFRGVARRQGRDAGNISVHLLDRGWCWMIPLPDDTMSVGIVSHPEFFKARKGDLKSLFLDTLAAAPSIAERMTEAEMISPVTSAGNYSYSAGSMMGDGYILIGDAFAFLDPIFSSGVLLAMSGATLGADAVEAWLNDPKSAEPLFREFDRRVRSALDMLSWLIYRINTPVMRDMFMEPQNRFRMREGLVSLLAGNVHAPKGLAVPMLAFKTIFYALSAARRLGFGGRPSAVPRGASASGT